MAAVVLSLRGREMSRTPMTHTRLTVGRDAGCDVVIDNAGVSRTHLAIVYLDDQFRVRDTDSQNGITVNGKVVKEAVLNYGDVIGVGKFELTLLETFDQIEMSLETGSKPKQAAPRNVMGTMQMSAVQVAQIRDQVTAKQAPKRAEPKAPAAAEAGVAVAPAPAAKPRPAANKPPPVTLGEDDPTEADLPPVGQRVMKPTPPARRLQRPSPAAPEPQPGGNKRIMQIAIGMAVLAVIIAVVAFMQ